MRIKNKNSVFAALAITLLAASFAFGDDETAVQDSTLIDNAEVLAAQDTVIEDAAPVVDFTAVVDSAVHKDSIIGKTARRRAEYLNFYAYRAEFITIPGEINSLGFSAEVGFFENDDFLYSLDVSAGVNYIGVMLNFGREFALYKDMRTVLGVSGGYHYTEILTNFKSRRSGKYLAHEYGKNEVYAGILWKVFPERSRQLDITSKLMFGHKTNSAGFNEASGEFTHKDGFGMTYSIGVGYMMRRWRGKRDDGN